MKKSCWLNDFPDSLKYIFAIDIYFFWRICKKKLQEIFFLSFGFGFTSIHDNVRADLFVFWFLSSSQQTFNLMKTSWRHLEDVFPLCLQNTPSRRLQDVFKTSCKKVFKTSSRRHQDVLNIFWRRLVKASCKNVFKTSSRRHQDALKIFWRRLVKTSSKRLQDILQIRLQDIFKASSRGFEDIFKTSPRRLQYICKTSCQSVFKAFSKCLQDVLQKRLRDIYKTSSKDLFKTFSRRIIRLNCLPRSRICLGHTSEKFMISVENLKGL